MIRFCDLPYALCTLSKCLFIIIFIFPDFIDHDVWFWLLINKNKTKIWTFFDSEFSSWCRSKIFLCSARLNFSQTKTMGEWRRCEPIYPFYADKKIPLFFLMCSPAIASKSTSIGKNWFLKVAGFRLWTISY